ncbi:hypothetical protein LINPERHAP2_LOCUS33643 [Linum perenne]
MFTHSKPMIIRLCCNLRVGRARTFMKKWISSGIIYLRVDVSNRRVFF